MITSNTKAIISFTSYPKRINAFKKTISKFIQFKDFMKDFHIVLNLYEDEFKNVVLPDYLKILVKNGILEILYHKKNYRVLMKTLFTMDKYRTYPVISADDDNFPLFNWPLYLYNEYKSSNYDFISFWGKPYKNTYHLGGNFTISSPFVFKEYGLKYLTDEIIALKEDDPYYTVLRNRMKLTKCKVITKFNLKDIIQVHDEVNPLHDIYRNRKPGYAMAEIEKIFDKHKYSF